MDREELAERIVFLTEKKKEMVEREAYHGCPVIEACDGTFVLLKV